MVNFNYKNAYKLAVQTNKELHKTLDSYKYMLEEAEKEIERLQHENTELLREKAMRKDPVF